MGLKHKILSFCWMGFRIFMTVIERRALSNYRSINSFIKVCKKIRENKKMGELFLALVLFLADKRSKVKFLVSKKKSDKIKHEMLLIVHNLIKSYPGWSVQIRPLSKYHHDPGNRNFIDFTISNLCFMFVLAEIYNTVYLGQMALQYP
jgi:hypothetical protein